MIFIAPDGTLEITATAECAALVRFSNRFAPGTGNQFFADHGVTVMIEKGPGRVPETLIVTDTVTGQRFALLVHEDHTGIVCVPFPAMS